ncbi:MAG: type I-D CRISPR-associated protein Cas5/Csc1 [Phormidesmis sp. RL_2_1]|nr:type I-D CRISPR-associated protein Cas5/Csc1 [Phormidesmis sp. RL_2_1]
MVKIYRCQLELHDSLYFATRELGRLYETEPIIHNYALSYVLGLVDSEKFATTVEDEAYSYRYFCGEQIPRYQEQLTPLNRQGIYVTPARAVQHTSVLNTWKYADNRYHVEMQPTERNIPSFGRTKEISAESVFEFLVVSEKEITFSRWVRIGKWASKAELTVQTLEKIKHNAEKPFVCSHPLNPLDVMFTNQVLSYDTINMPPVSLIHNVSMKGAYYTTAEMPELKLPIHMRYHFGE